MSWSSVFATKQHFTYTQPEMSDSRPVGRPKSQPSEAIARKIRKLRASRKLSQPAFALLCNVSLNTVGRWERAKVTPSPDHLLFLCEEFGRTMNWFYDQ
jgi:DNA-binding transcriptional regulator YiaG